MNSGARSRQAMAAYGVALLVALLAPEGLAGQEASPGSSRAPDAPAVARRALVLHAIYSTHVFPRAGEDVPDALLDALDEERLDILRWLRREKLWNHATSRERRILETPVGRLSREDGARVSAQREGLVVLLYALGHLDRIPSYDGSASYEPAVKKCPRIGMPVAAFLRDSRLRDTGAIDRARETAELWQWRAQTRELREARKFPAGKDLDDAAQAVREQMLAMGMEPREITDGSSLFAELVRFSSHWAHARGMIDKPEGDDFPARKKAFRDLDGQEFAQVRAIARERQHALRWLRGAATDWDDSAPGP